VIDLEALIREARDMEPLPATAARLAGLVAAEDPDLNEIVDVITYDQALTAKLLRYANSAASASRHPISTVRTAVIRMGIGTVLAVTVASAMRGRLDSALPQFGLGEGEMWRHSVASAVAAETVAGLTDVFVPPESFTAALLHDVGKLLLARHLDQEVQAWLRRALEEGGRTSVDAEAELLGVSHGELGGLIAQHWKLPISIVQGISFHHDPNRGGSPICDVVYVANSVAKQVLEMPDGGDAGLSPDHGVLPEPLARLGLDAERSARVVTEAADRLDEVLAQYAVA